MTALACFLKLSVALQILWGEWLYPPQSNFQLSVFTTAIDCLL